MQSHWMQRLLKKRFIKPQRQKQNSFSILAPNQFGSPLGNFPKHVTLKLTILLHPAAPQMSREEFLSCFKEAEVHLKHIRPEEPRSGSRGEIHQKSKYH